MAIYINTNQNVQINYEISSIGDRIIAYLIDSLVISGVSLGIFLLSNVIGLGYGTFLLFAIIFFYHFICELTMNGQSVGKRNRGIRVMKKDGNAATISAYFLRFLLRPIDTIYGLGLAIMFFTKHQQRLGDLAAGTIVVNVKSENELKQQIREEMSIDLQQEVMYPEVVSLTDKEVQLIRTVLRNRVDHQRHENVVELARKIGDKTGAQFITEESYPFLLRVVQDYYKVHTTNT